MDEMTLREPEFIGRADELEKLSGALADAIKGEGATIFLAGEAGIGKTRLMDAFHESASEGNIRILRGAASADVSQPFLIMTNALGEVLDRPLFEELESKGFAKLFAVNRAGMLVAETSGADEDMDADIFAGMLAAVQDFVRDSLDTTGELGPGLGRLEYGNMKILIEHGEHVFLTAVFAGEEHADMQPLLRRTMTGIEERHSELLGTWSGRMQDAAPIQEELSGLADARFLVRRSIEGMDIQAERLRIADEVLEVLKRLAGERPIAVILEDLHWAEESSLFVINYLARNVRGSPILLLGTLRPKESEVLEGIIEGMKGEGILDEMVLEHLELGDTVEIINRMFENNDFPDSLAKGMFEQSRGNPLFVIEMLKGMHADGNIARQSGGFTLVSDSYHIPETVEEVVNRRLGALDADAMAMAEYASCVGQSFDSGIMGSNRMIGEPGQSIERLVRSGILNSRNGTLEFSHALFQSVIYESIGDRWKVGHHRALGEYFETAYADNPDEVIFELARHFSRTNEHGKCVEYCTRAGEKAEGSYALERALEFYEAALGALPGLDKTFAAAKRLDLLERLGDVRSVMGLYDDAIDDYRRAKEAAEDRVFKARMLRKSANLLTNKGDFDESLKQTREAAELIDGKAPVELGKIWLEDGTTCFRKGDFDRSMTIYKEALDAFTPEVGTYDAEVAATLNGIGNVHYHRGEMRDALEYYRRSLELSERVGNPKEIALLLGNMGSVTLGLGNINESLDYFHKSLEIRERIGDILGIAQTENNLGVIFQDKGELDKALEHFHRGLEIAEKLGSKVGISILLYNIGNLYHSKGELDTALGIYNRCLEIRDEIGDRQGLAYALYLIGRIFKTKGEKANAKKNYEESLEISQEIGDKQMSIHPLCSLAEYALDEEDIATAKGHAEKAVGIAVDQGLRGEEGLARRVLAMVLRHSKELDKAAEELERSRSILEEVGHREELARTFKEYAFFYRAQGEPVMTRENMEKAISMFDEMGMKLWAEDCRKALESLSSG